MNEHKNINEALAAVYGGISGYVQKHKSDKLNYSFAGEADLIAAIRPALVEHGIVISIAEYVDVERCTMTTKNGAIMNVTMLRAVVRFTHTSGTHVDVQALGEGADSGDKSTTKAMTCAYKYALRQTFAIETGDDPDKDQNNVYDASTAKPLQKQEPSKQSAPKMPFDFQPATVADAKLWVADYVDQLPDAPTRAQIMGMDAIAIKALRAEILNMHNNVPF